MKNKNKIYEYCLKKLEELENKHIHYLFFCEKHGGFISFNKERNKCPICEKEGEFIREYIPLSKIKEVFNFKKHKTRDFEELKKDIIEVLKNKEVLDGLFVYSCRDITQKLGYKPTAYSYVWFALNNLERNGKVRKIIRNKSGKKYYWKLK